MLRHLKIHFYMTITLAAIFVTTTLTFSHPAHAAETLTEKIINNWISSQQAFENWGELNNDTLAAYEEQNSEQTNPLAISPQEMLAPLKASGLYLSAEQLVQRAGFSTLVEWAEITLRITKTAAAIQLASQQSSGDFSELEALKDSQAISDKQKRLIDNAIKQNQAITTFLETGVSDEDKAVVRPYLSHISRLLSSD